MNNLSEEEATEPPCQSPRCLGVAERGQNHTCPSGKKHICPSTSSFLPNRCYQTRGLSVCGEVYVYVCEVTGDPLHATMINSISDGEPSPWLICVCLTLIQHWKFFIRQKEGRDKRGSWRESIFMKHMKTWNAQPGPVWGTLDESDDWRHKRQRETWKMKLYLIKHCHK